MSHISTSLNINIAVITVVYQNYEVLSDFFKSFQNQTDKNFHIFVSDLSVDKKPLRQAQGKQSTIISGENKGYAYGVNLAIKQAIKLGYDKFCVINSDTFVKENFVHQVISAVNNHQSSIIGGKIYYAPGFEYHKTRYLETDAGKVLWYAGGTIDWNNVFIKHTGVDEVDNGQFDKFGETEFITGCLMAFDKKVIDRVGFWDEKYFLYYEDADFCERAKRKGIKLFYDPSIVIWHKNAQSTGGSGGKLHQKYQKKNRIKFALKYAPLKTKLHILKNYLSTVILGRNKVTTPES